MYLQQYEVSMTILDYFYPRLKNYIDFDILDYNKSFVDILKKMLKKENGKLLDFIKIYNIH